MSEKYFFEVPYTSSLRKKEGWSSDKSSHHKHFVFRFHFMLVGHQSDPLTIKRGEVVAPYSSQLGWVRKITDTTEWEYTDVDMQECVKDALLISA
jgi:hypothetical protein